MQSKMGNTSAYHRGISTLAASLGIGGLICLILAFTVGCDRADSAGAATPRERPRPVQAVQLVSAAGVSHRTFPGAAQALRDTDLSFRVGGPLVTLAAETGRHVAKGTIIARIDSRDFEVQLHTTQARLAASRACLEEATLQFERYAKLVREKASAKATYDRVKAAYETAQAQVAEDTRRVETARNALSDTALSAPYDGYIHHKYVENYETVAAGQPVVSMVDLSAIEVGVALPENFLPIVNQFRSFSCRFDALPGASFTACLKEVGKQPNATTRTYPMTLVLEPGKARTVPQVRPGMAAEVTITIACNDNDARCFMVPVTAVANDSDHQSFVWLLDNEKQAVQHHPVTVTGVTDHGLSITGDLKAGQWVVSAGVHYLTNHQRVRLLQPPGLSNVGAEP